MISVGLVYALSYLGFRLLSTEVWEKDGHSYVIFPEKPLALYYLFRPMTYLDGSLTNMRFHIGPHRTSD